MPDPTPSGDATVCRLPLKIPFVSRNDLDAVAALAGGRSSLEQVAQVPAPCASACRT
jgi:hypothetical protein